MLPFMLFAALAAPNPEAGVKAAITEFARAADARDVAALERVLAPEFRVLFFVRGKDQVVQMSRADYLGAATAGKIGGDTRAVTIEKISVDGPIARADVRLTGAKAEFKASMTLVKTAQGWKLAQDATGMTPRG